MVEDDDEEGCETEADGAGTDVEGGARAGRRRQRKRVQSWGSSVKRHFNISASSEKSGSNRNSGKSTTTTTTSTSGRSVVANNNAAKNVPAQPAAAQAPESTAFITIGNGQSAVRIQEGPVLGVQLAEEPEEEEEVVPGGSGGDDGGDREPTSNELRARMRQLAGPSPEPQEVLEEQRPVKHACESLVALGCTRGQLANVLSPCREKGVSESLSGVCLTIQRSLRGTCPCTGHRGESSRNEAERKSR